LAQHPVCSGCRSTLKECPVCRELYDKRLIRHRSDDFFDFMVFFLYIPAGMLKEIMRSWRKLNTSCQHLKTPLLALLVRIEKNVAPCFGRHLV
jgi:hypothetical protein